jgi:hypothetical protein
MPLPTGMDRISSEAELPIRALVTAKGEDAETAESIRFSI